MDWKRDDLVDNRYRIESRLGSGGFGITYKAKNQLHLPFVLKTPRADLRDDLNYSRFVEQFKREAANLARFAQDDPHPHIVRIIELLEVPITPGSRERIPCLVMDFIGGESLYQRVVWQKQALPEAEAVRYIRQIGEALMVVHEAGLVHWDANPQNIMLKPNGNAVLIDFGIAGDCPPSSFSRSFGNRAFAPYEQTFGERSPVVDLYTLAASLYYAVTGQLPILAMERKCRNLPLTSPQEHCPQLSQRVNTAILAAMALEPQERPPSVAAWLEQLGTGEPEAELRIDEGRYGRLRDLLAVGEWREADEETGRVMLKVANREAEGWLDVKDIDKFPCEDLRQIDRLWVKYSNGRFGFSVQKQIYQQLGGTRQYDEKVWEAFGDRVGWRKGGKWLYYTDQTFSTQAPVAHLPLETFWKVELLYSRRFGVGVDVAQCIQRTSPVRIGKSRTVVALFPEMSRAI
jgi:eukaryotic-like serine/threonine-protein kinase